MYVYVVSDVPEKSAYSLIGERIKGFREIIEEGNRLAVNNLDEIWKVMAIPSDEIAAYSREGAILFNETAKTMCGEDELQILQLVLEDAWNQSKHSAILRLPRGTIIR